MSVVVVMVVYRVVVEEIVHGFPSRWANGTNPVAKKGTANCKYKKPKSEYLGLKNDLT